MDELLDESYQMELAASFGTSPEEIGVAHQEFRKSGATDEGFGTYLAESWFGIDGSPDSPTHMSSLPTVDASELFDFAEVDEEMDGLRASKIVLGIDNLDDCDLSSDGEFVSEELSVGVEFCDDDLEEVSSDEDERAVIEQISALLDAEDYDTIPGLVASSLEFGRSPVTVVDQDSEESDDVLDVSKSMATLGLSSKGGTSRAVPHRIRPAEEHSPMSVYTPPKVKGF